ncbi:hypothetical protein MLD38_010599 [Melastoma candidum]|uniref:Uncharacterized protein n=1 Tax=Melastoma candidum TaxID=119954 RepID=A0ACB9R0E5_9MYRT|nr:hypothetical protein MLD38_010599 [Melastoma candidum]
MNFICQIRKVYEKEDNTIALERLADEIARSEEQVRVTERKLDEMKQELEELRKKRAAIALKLFSGARSLKGKSGEVNAVAGFGLY